MLKKKPVKNSDTISVTFSANVEEASDVSVVGEFNEWEPGSTPMKRRKDGSWSTALRLPDGSRHEYRFVIDGETWLVDEEADELVPNPFGGTNSVVVLN